MNKEQEDYIKLEEAAKEWINKTDDSQFETYELLAMFASGEIEKLFSLPVATNRTLDCRECKNFDVKVINKTGGTCRVCKAKPDDHRAIVDLTPPTCKDYMYGW